jgi:hypothetical protein
LKRFGVKGVATLVLLNCLLLVPSWIVHGRPGPHLFALEAGIVVGIFLVLPRHRLSRALALTVSATTVVLAVLLLGDATARLSLGRPLNLYLDVRLVRSVSHLLDGNLGAGWGPVALAAIGAVGAAAAWGLYRLLASLRPRGRMRDLSGNWWLRGALLVSACTLLIPLRWIHPRGVVFALPSVQLVRDQSAHLTRMLGERERFSAEMAASPRAYRSDPSFLGRLGNRDVVLAFIESYGVSAVEDARYAPLVQPRLRAMEAAFDRAGIHVATGLLVAPSQGGMSWLGHGSVLSGLWLENQLRYDLLMASDRATLVDDFEAAGYRTAALMPAITLAWPEGQRLGYDQIWTYHDIDYAGPPLNWVTMPDQFTWSFLENTIRAGDDGRPLFAELGLISSHAPWTPILEVLDDWDAIGNGRVFQRWKDAGESPEELWRDVDRVREHYARSVGYALDALSGYALRYLDEGTLLVAMGDHQPAPLITGDGASRAVPVHVMATSPELLSPFLDWGFTLGATPSIESSPRRMDAFRHWFVSAYSEPYAVVAQE